MKSLEEPTTPIYQATVKRSTSEVCDYLDFQISHEDLRRLINNRFESKRNEEFYSLLLAVDIYLDILESRVTRITRRRDKSAASVQSLYSSQQD